MKTFNTTAVCIPDRHYMVNLTTRLEAIKSMVDDGKYFTINRARQYGKTTLLKALEKYLAPDYVVVSLDFLAQLRAGYIDRDTIPAFHSVILAGVTDIKNLKRKLRPEESHKLNSPWNIAADFNIEMSFSAEDITGMLNDYESEHHTGMDTNNIARLIYDYTGGYPFLVSRMCQYLDEKIPGTTRFQGKAASWTTDGVNEAARLIEGESNTLFESMIGKLYDYPELENIIRRILFNGEDIPYSPLEPSISQAVMYGFIKEKKGKLVVSNRIFETVFYNLFLTSQEMQKTEIWKAANREKYQFIENGQLNMERILL